MLKDVCYYHDRPSHILLIMNHEGSEYLSCIMFDDAPTCEKIAANLHQYLGMSMDSLGSLALDAT